jgi:sarcosine oxidase subunit alpha
MAAPVLTTPLHARWEAMGAEMTDVLGWRVPARFGDGTTEARAARNGVALGDETPRGKLLVQGDAAARVVTEALGAAPERVGEVSGREIASCRLRPDLLFVGTVPIELEAARKQLDTAAAAADLVSVTDVTHGRFEFRLLGPSSAELLSRVCGLDFDDSAFPDLRARETSVARIKALVVRADAGERPAYRLLGGRALGAYVWDALMEAGVELGIAPIGSATLRDLKA